MNKFSSISIVVLLVLTSMTSGCGDPPDKKAAPPTSPTKAAQQSEKFMPVTVSQFVEIYNKEISRRHGDQYILGDGTSVKPTAMVYTVPDGHGSTLTIDHSQTDNKVSAIMLTIQGSQGEKFDQKARRAWAASIISAACPGISNDDVIEIRGSMFANKPITKNGIFYMMDYTEKGSPFFQIIARAQ